MHKNKSVHVIFFSTSVPAFAQSNAAATATGKVYKATKNIYDTDARPEEKAARGKGRRRGTEKDQEAAEGGERPSV